MNISTSLFADPVQTVHFLSIFSYIHTLSDIFYSENLIEEHEQFQPFPVVNAYFEYLSLSHDEIEAKRNLTRRLLRNSDLYGGGENETLDIEYVNATFDHMVSSVVFSQYGNIYGYLAEIVSLSNNLTLPSLKQELFDDLQHLDYLNGDGSVSYLSFLSIVRILETLIWPLFPQTEQNMRIIDIDYIYAQAGLMLARSVPMNLTNITSNDYITMSQPIELAALKNEIDQSALRIFTLPALLNYAHREKESFRKQKVAYLIEDDDFWSEAFLSLFSHLNQTFETINRGKFESSPLYQFELAMSKFKTRRLIDESVIIKNDTDSIFSAQVDEIKSKYYSLEEVLIREAFHTAKLIDRINLSDAIALPNQIVPTLVSSSSATFPSYHPIVKPNISLFAIRQNGFNSFYAMVQNLEDITLLAHDDGHEAFFNKLGLSVSTRFEVSSFIEFAEKSTDKYHILEKRLAKIKAEDFSKLLHASGHANISREDVLDGSKSFVPFHYCLTQAKEDPLSCFEDIVRLIPFVERVTKRAPKLSTIAAQRLSVATGASFRTSASRHAVGLALDAGLDVGVAGFGTMTTDKILTKGMFKNLSLGLISTVGPGFEPVGRLLQEGGLQISKLFRRIWTTAKKFPLIGAKLPTYEKIWNSLENMPESADGVQTVSPSIGRMVFRNIYPGGVNPYGPQYIRLPEENAEMRSVHHEIAIPVVVSRISLWGQIYYKKIDLRTGKTFGGELELNRNGLLRIVDPPPLEQVRKNKTEGLSSRGTMKIEKIKHIEMAAGIVSKANLNISREEAVRVMEEYFFEDEIDTTPNVIPINSVLHPYTDVDNVPTYIDFALDWVRSKGISDVYNNFRINNPQQLDDLLYSVELDNITGEDIHEATDKIVALYGPHYQKQTDVEIADIINRYDVSNAREYVNFEDFYAISNWVKNGLVVIDQNVNPGRLLRIALLRFAIRQVGDNPKDYPELLYRVEERDQAVVEKYFSQKVGQSIRMDDEFLVSSMYQEIKPRFQKRATNLSEELTADADTMLPVVYEIHINSPYLIANVNDVVPTEDRLFAILPNVELTVDSVNTKKVGGNDVVYVVMCNEPVKKEMWVRTMIRELEALQAAG